MVTAPTLTFPHSRAECESGPRPCPWIRCTHHLYLPIQNYWQKCQGLRSRYKELEPWELPYTCVLDVVALAADRGGTLTLREVGEILGYCKERIRQIQVGAIESLTPKELQQLRTAAEDAPRYEPAPLSAHHAVSRLVQHYDSCHDGTIWSPLGPR